MAEDTFPYEILRSVRKILRKTTEHSRQIAKVSGLTVPQVLCLRAIADAKKDTEVTVAMVSEAVQLSSPTVSRIVDRLYNEGLIERERGSTDRRRVCLTLTEAGKKQLQKAPTPLHDAFLNRLKALDEKHQVLLLQSLNQLVEMMEASDIDAAPMLTTEADANAPAVEE